MLEPKQETKFAETPEGEAQRWSMELKAAQDNLAKFHTKGDEIVKRFRDEHKTDNVNDERLSLFPSHMQTVGGMLYGRMPQVSVARKYADADDDEARVASEMLERQLNCDIERKDDSFAEAVQYATMDWLLPGLGLSRVRYEVEWEDVAETPAIMHPETGAEMAPAVPAGKRKKSERAATDYVFWKDVLFSPARVWHEFRWIAFKAEMDREKATARFPRDGPHIPLNAKRAVVDDDTKGADPWARAEVWEIWDKERRQVFWYVEGYPRILDSKEDPLGLEGFWPCPRPLAANLTTSAFIPTPDYRYAQDLYKSIDQLTMRIGLLRDAIRVAGVYDRANESIKQLLEQTGTNKLIPVDNWGAFGEAGGLKGVIDWLPLEVVVAALNSLRDVRREEMDLLFQVTGTSDIMRGQQMENGTPGEAQVKARFGSVRIQAKQDELARFASDIQKLKAEIISKHFDVATIIEQSNVMRTPDAAMAQQAAELIKSRFADLRIEIKPEAINLTDFSALKQERTEVIASLAGFMSAAAPLVAAMPNSMVFLLKLLQAQVAGLRGSSAMESVLDEAIKAAVKQQEQAAANPQPAQQDPKVQAEQMKLQGAQMKGAADMQKEQFKLQADLTKIQAETQAHAEQERTQAEWNTKEATQKALITHALKMQEPQPQPGGGNGG